jgi:lipopolysaccharide/colanic/teichoic acid biosynthesis glycosyltransferase
LSPWTRSPAKRAVDVALVLGMLLVFAPLCLLIAVAIRLTSRGPAFFLQRRVGAGGELFSILKFRTMVHQKRPEKDSITTIDDDQITALGRVLRFWKVDELPQLWNVLRGEMSLVGPRPRVPEQQTTPVGCRPGITGAASLAFAREEVMLAGIPRDLLATYYASRVLPIKQRMDDEYMAQATFFSDAKLLLRTVLRVWTPAGALDLTDHIVAVPGRLQDAVMPGESCD